MPASMKVLHCDGMAPKDGGSTVQAPPVKAPAEEQACGPAPKTEQRLSLSLATEQRRWLGPRVEQVPPVTLVEHCAPVGGGGGMTELGRPSRGTPAEGATGSTALAGVTR